MFVCFKEKRGIGHGGGYGFSESHGAGYGTGYGGIGGYGVGYGGAAAIAQQAANQAKAAQNAQYAAAAQAAQQAKPRRGLLLILRKQSKTSVVLHLIEGSV